MGFRKAGREGRWWRGLNGLEGLRRDFEEMGLVVDAKAILSFFMSLVERESLTEFRQIQWILWVILTLCVSEDDQGRRKSG